MNVDARSGWALAIDFGTSYTAAAVAERGRVDVLEIEGERRLPSVVFLEDDGTLAVGESAVNRAALLPERVEQTAKSYLNFGEPDIILGDRQLKVTHLVGRVLQAVWQEALRQHNGNPPSEAYLTHPAAWSEARRRLLVEAAAHAGIQSPVLVSEPEAAALHLSSERAGGDPVPDGRYVAVYDLGGGTFDTAVLRRKGERFELVGKPGGDEKLGGVLFDDLLYRELGETALDPHHWEALTTSPDRERRRANYRFREDVRKAKEEVSKTASYAWYVPLPVGKDVQVTREQFERLIGEHILRTLNLLDETLRGAGVGAKDLAALYLVGGSSRIPIVAHSVRSRFGRADTKGEPKTVVALGAAGKALQPEPPPPPPPTRPPPEPEPAPPQPDTGGRRRVLVIGAVVLALGGGVAALAANSSDPPTSTTPVTTIDDAGTTSPDTDTSGGEGSGSSDVTGTWSGTISNDADESETESVDLDIVSFDGYEDGTVATELAGSNCTGTLEYRERDGDYEIFDVAPEGDCIKSTLTVELDTSDGTLYVREEWQDEGTVSYSGWLDPE